ncbi:MAG TPA: hypothetical protein VMG80_08370 [Solirubrobacteraceae bacterium]|nr:hypothetical protein [Solirubrobacteraceae bacterium]
MSLSKWELIGLAALCGLALFGYFAYPTYPTYDSFYALLWGRDVLHLHLPDLRVYRGPTEHPLAIGFGFVCALFGQAGARLMVLGSVVSFVAVVAGMYRLGKLCFGPVVGLVAALLVLSRFFVENLAAQGYLDITYVALIVWAIVFEVRQRRCGTPVFVLLAAAGLLRPEAWVLSGAYWLWCCWPNRGCRPNRGCERQRVSPGFGSESLPNRPRAGVGAGVGADGASGTSGYGNEHGGVRTRARTHANATGGMDNGTRLRYLGLALIAPVIWVAVDAIVTGDPLYSLHSTSELAQELERTQGLGSVLVSVWTFGVRIDKVPVLLGGLIGVPIAIWLAPRRVLVPLAALVLLAGVFVLEGAGGASVVDRYLMGASIVLLLFCAVTVGGWAMLEPGSLLRRLWMAGAAVLVLYGGVTVANTLNLSNLRTTLAYHEDFHEGLAAALNSPRVKAILKRCPLVSLPDNKLIPDARWILDSSGQNDIVARSQAHSDAERGSKALEDRFKAGSVAVFPLGSAVFFEAIVDVGDDPRVEVPRAGYKRIYTSKYYAVYDNC